MIKTKPRIVEVIECGECGIEIELCDGCGIEFSKNDSIWCENILDHFCEKCYKNKKCPADK